MKVLITSLGGKKHTLNVFLLKEDAPGSRDIVTKKGIYIAKDEHGNKFVNERGQAIEFNIASKSGVGFLNGVEYTYLVDGYLNT